MLHQPSGERGRHEGYNTPSNGPIDLDALDDYLMSDHAPDDSMGLSDLDGFLTGVVVGPELILPSEWLPVIWGGGRAGIRDPGGDADRSRHDHGPVQRDSRLLQQRPR